MSTRSPNHALRISAALKPRAFSIAASICLATAFAAGCSDDESPGGSAGVACDANFTPCGGDVEGTWNYQSACTDYDFASDIQTVCPGAAIENVSVGVTGTLELNGGTVGGGGTYSTSFTGTIPQACAAPLGGCSGLANALGQGDDDITVSCTGETDCSCTYTENGDATLGSSYSVSGNVVTSDGTDYEYCVSDTTLTYRAVSQGDEPQITFVLTR